MRRVNAWAALAVASSTLAISLTWPGVPVDPGPAPLTESARASAFQLLLDLQWLPIAREYPDAVQPDTEIIAASAPGNWDVTIEPCYQQAGFAPQGAMEAWQWSVSDGVEERIAQYICDASYPPEETLAGLRSGSELYALYDYYVEVLTPCLELAGAPPPAPAPERATFIQQSTTAIAWSPVPGDDDGVSDRQRALLDALCPPEPAWMRSR